MLVAMDPKTPPDRVLLAPGAGMASAYHLPGVSDRARPRRRREVAPDERLVEPDTRWEKIDGKRVYASPAQAPHADSHFGLVYVLGAHVAKGFIGSDDLLTRTDQGSDFATDASIRRAGQDPKTGGRHLEELSFEVASTQTLSDLRTRARKLVERGVRRVFAILVAEGEVREWSRTSQTWEPLAQDDEIRDVTLRKPLKVRALLDAASADRAVAEALWEKREPFLVEINDQTRLEGKAQGWAEAILATLAARGLEPTLGLRERVLACRDPETLKRWHADALVARTREDLAAFRES